MRLRRDRLALSPLLVSVPAAVYLANALWSSVLLAVGLAATATARRLQTHASRSSAARHDRLVGVGRATDAFSWEEVERDLELAWRVYRLFPWLIRIRAGIRNRRARDLATNKRV